MTRFLTLAVTLGVADVVVAAWHPRSGFVVALLRAGLRPSPSRIHNLGRGNCILVFCAC